MDTPRFDSIARRFAERRFSRRRMLGQGSAVLSAATLAASGGAATSGVTGETGVTAQEATPSESVASGAAAYSQSMFLFVQSFQSGSIAPKDGSGESFTITLERGLGQTIYFSDRPERIVGAAPTARFLEGFDFSPENPPNAALLVESDCGETVIAVVELTNPGYDEGTHTATYDAIELAEFWSGTGVGFHPDPAGAATLPASFTSAHLFIDDCRGEVVACYPYGQSQNYEAYLGFVKASGMCWDQLSLTCTECNPAPDILACQAKYPDQCTDAKPCEAVRITPP